MGCNCGGSRARALAIQNQRQAQQAKPEQPTVPPTQAPGYFAGPKKPTKPA